MRRKAKTAPKNKKILRKIFFTIIILGILAAASWLIWKYIRAQNFPIKHIKIFATYEHIDQNTLQKTIDTYLTNDFFYLNVTGLKKQLLKFPWIYAVSIKREWPDTVTVNIAEQRALLQWGEKALVNPDGTVFYPPKNTFPKDLPIIIGPIKNVPEIFTTYHQMLAILEPLDLVINKLILNPKHHWEIILNNGTQILLKTHNTLSQLELLANVYRKITADHGEPPKSIDLRYNSGMAVRW